MHTNSNKHECAVSPVVGVMLMLVVTIIIAAVVSAFAGGLSTGSKTAPVASFECHISNSGSWGDSMFDIAVMSTDKAIPTKDLKLVTTWTNTSGYPVVTTINGGAMPVNNTYYSTSKYNSPLGFGPGVNQTTFSGSYYADQNFGNYSLMSGTHMHNSAAGYSSGAGTGGSGTGGYGVTPGTRFQYTDGTYHLYPGSGYKDAMMAILGDEWHQLRAGNVVNVQLIHIPSQKVIFDKDVTVEGA